MTLDRLDSTRILQSRPLLMKRFEVLRVLGEGAAGAVYLVLDKKHQNRKVALKVLVNQQAFDEHTCERFYAEWKVSRDLDHPNLVKAYDLIKFDDAVAFTMEYVEGGDLRQLLSSAEPDYTKLDSIFIQLLDALEYLHQHLLYHRDIKLENIMLTPAGKVKLSDLGLMKLKSGSYSNEKLTQTGILLGTAQYMPPEYIISSHYDHCSDVYAVGIVLYEILSGGRWLADKTGNDVITHLIRTHFEFPEITRVKIPKKYQFILQHCLQSKTAKRFQSADEVKEYFEKSMTDEIWDIQRETQEAPVKKPAATHTLDEDLLEPQNCTTAYFMPLIFAGLFVLLLAVGTAITFNGGAERELSLSPGTYHGTINDYSSIGEKPVQLQVGPIGAVLLSRHTFCPNGFINFKEKNLTCNANSYRISSKNINVETELYVTSLLGQKAIIKVKKIN